jgi:hypothetical protein
LYIRKKTDALAASLKLFNVVLQETNSSDLGFTGEAIKGRNWCRDDGL